MEDSATALNLSMLYEPEVLANPYPFYAEMRARDPVHWDEEWKCWAVSRYADVMTLNRDPRFSQEMFTAPEIPPWVPEDTVDAWRTIDQAIGLMLIFREPPDHTRLRSLVTKAFTPAVVETMRSRVQRLVDSILDKAAAEGGMDAIADLAAVVPATVIAELLGVPVSDREQFQRWSAAIVRDTNGDGQPETRLEARKEFKALIDYMRDLTLEHQRHPQDDLVQGLINASEQGDKLTMDEVVANAVGLLFAGHETTTNLIGNGLLALLQHPEQLLRLRDDPTLIKTTIEECLRYDTPLQETWKIVKEDVILDGKQLSRGQLVVGFRGAANRDPAQFPDADQFDVGRQENRHVSFSHGIHYCLGAPLARIESQIAIGSLVQRFPTMKMTTPTPLRRTHRNFRGLMQLPIAWG